MQSFITAFINSSDIRLYYEPCHSEGHVNFITDGNIQSSSGLDRASIQYIIHRKYLRSVSCFPYQSLSPLHEGHPVIMSCTLLGTFGRKPILQCELIPRCKKWRLAKEGSYFDSLIKHPKTTYLLWGANYGSVDLWKSRVIQIVIILRQQVCSISIRKSTLTSLKI